MCIGYNSIYTYACIHTIRSSWIIILFKISRSFLILGLFVLSMCYVGYQHKCVKIHCVCGFVHLSFGTLRFCFIWFEATFLGEYKLRNVIFFLVNWCIIIRKCPYLTIYAYSLFIWSVKLDSLPWCLICLLSVKLFSFC